MNLNQVAWFWALLVLLVGSGTGGIVTGTTKALLAGTPLTSSNSLANNCSSNTTTTSGPPPPPVDKTDANLTAPQLIVKYGFPLEVHNVTTSDGYILTNHRIPRPGAFPIFVSHGILCSSRDFLMQRGTNGLAYLLYNAGYDVWLGNLRGNNYSMGHVNLSSDDAAYWNFAVDQISLIDVPANIDYVLNATNQSSLGWIGYSLGTTTLIAGLIAKPEYQVKVKAFVGLAPVTVTTNCASELMRLLASLTLPEEPLKSSLTAPSQGRFLPKMAQDAINRYLPELCAPQIDRPDFCGDSLALVGGFNPKQMDNDMQPVIFGGFPSSISVRMLVQQLQGIIYGANKFRRYNFQVSSMNNATYGTTDPPSFDLTQFKVPTLLFAGLNDFLAAPKDVAVLVARIPNLVYFHNVTDCSWSHLDFVFAKQAKELVYDLLIEQLTTLAPPSVSTQ